jgi:hypothetical protein
MQGALWCQRLGVSENVTACLQETHRSMQPARYGHRTMLLYGNGPRPAGLRVAERRGRLLTLAILSAKKQAMLVRVILTLSSPMPCMS